MIALISTLIAVWYRFGHNLTVDEPFMANMARRPWSELWDVFPVDNVPLAYVALKCWTAVFGESEVALRTLSALFFGAMVLMTGAAAHRTAGPSAGIAAAILASASDRIGLEHAATARPYALLACVTAAALLQSIRLLTGGTNGRRASVASYLIHLAGLFTHPTYVVVVLACAGGAVLSRQTIRSPIVTTCMAALATYIAVWGVVVLKTVALQTTSWMHTPGLADVQRACMLIWGVGPGFMLVGALVALTFRRFSYVLETLREAPTRWIVATVVLAWVVPIIISLRQPIFEPTRTPMMLLPITSAAVAVLLARLGGSGVALAFAGICVVAAAQRVLAEPRVDPYPTRDSLAALLPRMRCGDTLVAPGLAPWPVEYYFRRLDAPTCIATAPFPKDPVNWAGRMRTPDRLLTFEQEASVIARQVAASGHSAWLLSLSRGELHEASRIAESALRREMSCAAPVPLKGAFFDAVIRCDARKEP